MKTLHWTGIVLLLVAYFVGAKFPQLAQKVGLA